MLQNRVNELNSAILDMKGNKVYITGFTREEMLQSFLDTGIEAWSSKGLYDYQELEFQNIKDDALIIVRRDEKEMNRYQYKQVYKGTIKFKNEEGKNVSRTFIIRKSTYSEQYHFYFVVEKEASETDDEKVSSLFNSKDELDKYLLEQYGVHYSY
ncbi:hypothetical protein J7E55_25900 [Bacillus sp. ISL-53]|nr:hypothetical protein [Bacillus sp. ISL-53]